MIYLVAFLAVFLFLVGLDRFGATRAAAKVLETSRAGASSMRDAALDDLGKERALRQASLTLLQDFASIGVRSLAALGLSTLPLLAADLVGLAKFAAVTDWLATWKAVIQVTILVGIWYWVRRII